jgi:hypothetical protein
MKNNDLTMRIIRDHFIANDDCSQKLKKSPILLDESESIIEYHNSLIQSNIPDLRDVNLLYFNLAVLDPYFKKEKVLRLKCPRCGRTYEIRKEEYLALRKTSEIPLSE